MYLLFFTNPMPAFALVVDAASDAQCAVVIGSSFGLRRNWGVGGNFSWAA